MSHYKPYPTYKDSGVEWIGPLPKHWDTIPLSKVSTDRCDGPFGSGLKSEHYVTAGVRVVRLQNIGSGLFRDEDAAFIDTDYWRDELGGGHDVVPGDLLVAGLGDENNPLGRACVAPASIGPAIVKADCYRFRLVPQANPEFVALALSATARGECGYLATGATRDRLNLTLASARKVPFPPTAEQAEIVSAIGREATRIDTLIAKKSRFIELLKEKRQALITHAVTKGLDPTVKMKDSGVEWIGEVPEHWTTLSTKRLFQERDERSATGREELLTVSHLTGVTPRSEKTVYMFEAETTEGYKICREGDFVINTLWAWMGAMGIARQDGIVSPAYNIYAPSQKLVSEFVDLVARMPIFAAEVTRYSKGVWTSRLRLYPEGFFEVHFAVPPVQEQLNIVHDVLRKTRRIDSLIDTTGRSIALLKERRAALITAAVTGQIDFRFSAANEP